MEPISTGVPGLDQVLHGGLSPKALHFVGGLPGTGKTTLAQQISYHHAKSGGKVLYLVALSETAEGLVEHARAFSFFDAAMVAQRIYYISVYPKLEEGGLAAVLTEARSLAVEHKASLVCLDGMATLKSGADSPLEFRRFVFDLNSQLRSLGVTALVLGTWDEEEASDPEFTVADGIVTMALECTDFGVERHLEVLKLRGTDPLVGRHSFSITGDGVAVFPRLEAALRMAGLPEPAGEWKRVSTGTSGLDQMLQGGIPSGSITLLSGPPGIGKTVLGLAFLAEGGRQGEKGIYFGFDEAPSRLISRADDLELGFGEMARAGVLQVHWVPGLELIPDELAWRLLDLLDRSGARRLVVDAMDRALASSVGSRQLQPLLGALMAALRSRDVTAIFTHEQRTLNGSRPETRCPGFGDAADNIILLRYAELQGELRRLISILRVRVSGFDPAIREFTIAQGGVHVGGAFRGAGSELSGTSRRRRRRAQ